MEPITTACWATSRHCTHSPLQKSCTCRLEGVPHGGIGSHRCCFSDAGRLSLGQNLSQQFRTLQCRSYTHFCACGKAVDDRLEALGGRRCAPRADINREDWKAVDAWIESAVASLLQLPLKTYAQSSGESMRWRIASHAVFVSMMYQMIFQSRM